MVNRRHPAADGAHDATMHTRTYRYAEAASCLSQTVSLLFVPLSSSHPGSLAVDLVYVSCSTAMNPSRGWSNVPTGTCIHGNSAPHILMIRQCYCGIMASDGETPRRDRRRQDGVNIPSLYPALLLITLGVSPIPDRSVLVLLRQVK